MSDLDREKDDNVSGETGSGQMTVEGIGTEGIVPEGTVSETKPAGGNKAADPASAAPVNERSGFAGLGIRDSFCAKLREWSIVDPAPVQRSAIPELMTGKDAIVESGTGTGKTLAYVLPMAEKLDATDKKLQGLVLVPTQELAMQIHRLLEGLLGNGRSAALIGGANLKRQIDRLKERPLVAVGTPGRVAELIRIGKLKTGGIRFAVVDEADQVFAPGAGDEAEAVLDALPKSRQLVFVSATITPETEAQAAKWMEGAVRPRGQTQAEAFASVSHEFVVCDRRDKIDVVRRFVKTVNPAAALLFVQDARRIGEIEAKLTYAGLAAEPLYADAGKQERSGVMRRLAAGKIRLVIATDLAARGLDVPHLTHVIQFEPPADAKTYLHRAGRTGRMGRSGSVVTLAAAYETAQLRRLARRLELPLRQMALSHGQWVPVPEDADGTFRGKRPAPAAKAKKGAGRDAARLSDSPAGRPSAAAPSGGTGKPLREPAVGRKKKEAVRQRDRKRDMKNKGAPRWLKEKWERDST